MRKALFGFIFFSCVYVAEATHLRCGQITLKLQSGFTYFVTLTLHTNLGSIVKPGAGKLEFGDGSYVITGTLDPILTNTPQIGLAQYTVVHTFPFTGSFLISYTEPNLDAGIVNVVNSVEVPFYAESKIFIDLGRDCSSPDFLTDPFYHQPVGNQFAMSTQAADKNDYSLRYEVVNPLQPGKSSFTLPDFLTINPSNGLVSWDTRYGGLYKADEYYFAARVTQYDHEGHIIGYVNRSFQIITEQSNSLMITASSYFDSNGKIFVGENSDKTLKVLFIDTPASNEVKWDIFFDDKIKNNVTFLQYDSATVTQKIKVGILKLHSSPDIIRDNPYAITLRGTSTFTIQQFSGFTNQPYSKDINYLFFTKDILLPLVTAVDGRTERNVKVFPNPFSTFLYVADFDSQEEAEIILTDISGRVIIDLKTDPSKPIDGSDLPLGIYILQIRSGLSCYRQKVVKK